MTNNRLILRTLTSPWVTPISDITRNSVLTHNDLDNNFIYLRGEVFYTGNTESNNLVLKRINGNDLSIDLSSIASGGTGDSIWSLTGGSDTSIVDTVGGHILESADYSSILGGNNARLDAGSSGSTIVGGFDNSLRLGNYSVVLNGFFNTLINSDYAGIIAGNTNEINSSEYAVIVGGSSHSITNSEDASILGGSGNTMVFGTHASILGGFNNRAIGNSTDRILNSSIIGGQDNFLDESIQDSTIIGGSGNTMSGYFSGGIIRGRFNGIIGGYDNTIDNIETSFIGGGNNNLIDGEGGVVNNAIVGGSYNSLRNADNTDNGILAGSGNTIQWTQSVNFRLRRNVINGGFNNQIRTKSGGGDVDSAAIIGGENGIISGSAYSFIAGGQNHLIDSTNGYNAIVGGNNHAIHVVGYAGIVAGENNVISGQSGGPSYEFIGGGNGNRVNHSEGSVIVGGANNEISSNGRSDNFIAGTINKIYESGTATIIGGVRNVINNDSNGGVIAGGGDSTITTSISGGVFGGNVNTLIDSDFSSIIGGQFNLLSGASQSVILGSNNITGTSDNTVYTTHLEVRGQANNPFHDNLSGSTNFVPDWDNSGNQILSLSGNTNISGGTATIKNGSTYSLLIKQTNGGGHSITWDSTYKWVDGAAPTLTGTDGSVDIITFISDGTNLYGLIAKNFQ